MDTQDVLKNVPQFFMITYYADKYSKFITRRGEKREGSQIKICKNGKPSFTYWDLDADGWRQASEMFSLKATI